LEKKIVFGKKKSGIAMLGPLLSMSSGQGLIMILLTILKINETN
jgi:hypothetical protein